MNGQGDNLGLAASLSRQETDPLQAAMHQCIHSAIHEAVDQAGRGVHSGLFRSRERQGRKTTTTGRQGPDEDIETLLIRLVDHRFPDGSAFPDGGQKLLTRY